MNEVSKIRTDLLGSDVPAVVVWGLAALCVAAWMAAHVLGSRFLTNRPRRFFGFAARVVLGTLALWAFWQAVARHLVLETTWPLSVNAFIGALAIEITLGLYALETRLVSRTVGRWLTGLRLLAVLAVLTMLVQPVFSRKEIRRVDRNVVVLVDESGSMQQADSQMPVEERLELAGFLGLEGLQNRPQIGRTLAEDAVWIGKLEAAAESVRPPDGVSESDSKALVQRGQEGLTELVKGVEDWVKRVEMGLTAQAGIIPKMPQDLRNEGQSLKKILSDLRRETLRQALEAVERGEGRKLRSALRDAAREISRASPAAASLVPAVGEQFYTALPDITRKPIDAAASRSRRDLALEAVTRKLGDQPSLLDQLKAKYSVRFMAFGKEAVETPGLPVPPEAGSAMASRTDLTMALTKVQEAWPPENLAGVILLSDARHNGPVPPDDAARRLGLQGSPLCPVIVGSAAGARDAAIAEVIHPRSIFLGDRLRVSVDLKIDRLRGKDVKLKLQRGTETIREEILKVPTEAWRTTISMDDTPAEKGIFSWKVTVDPVEGEQFLQNNEWNFEAAVSDDRTNVLLIDDRPRWEFRYLRNLFDSRDKSVQLQYVLLNPDKLDGADPLPNLPAAADRPFGESEATRLPATPEEWRKFDVIILGDVPPDAVDEKTWKIIRDCVGNRGAMLVMVAGRNFLPQAFAHPVARELIPLKYEASGGSSEMQPEPAYKLALTAEGRQSPVFSQSLSGMENARIWEQMPVLRWRYAHLGVKEGAQVLAWARPVAVDGQGMELAVPEGGTGQGDPATELQRRRKMENDNALVTAAQVDLGKVVMLAFDQTWRFRYGVGDTYHHRFWGQLLRWGAGESLPSGTPSVRLGTDLLTYEPGQAITVHARLRDEAYQPLQDGKVKVTLYRDTAAVSSRNMEFRKDSQGLYEAKLEGVTEPGKYRVELSGQEVEQLAGRDGLRTVDQMITVGTADNAVELGDLTVDREMAARLASLSRGIVTGLADVERVLPLFGPETKEIEERRETSLWDNWIILAVAVGAMTTEWIIRRRNALA